MTTLSPRLLIGVASVIALFILFSLAQEMNRRLHVQREVVRLEQDVQQLEHSLLAMENLNQYFRTAAFQERMAREKLNYRAEGEKVVLIHEEILEATREETPEVVPGSKSVPQLWWQVFFDPFVSES